MLGAATRAAFGSVSQSIANNVFKALQLLSLTVSSLFKYISRMLVVFLYDIDELYIFTLHVEHILNPFFVERQFSGSPTVEGREGQVVSVVGAVVDHWPHHQRDR